MAFIIIFEMIAERRFNTRSNSKKTNNRKLDNRQFNNRNLDFYKGTTPRTMPFLYLIHSCVITEAASTMNVQERLEQERNKILQQFTATAKKIATFDARIASVFVRSEGQHVRATPLLVALMGCKIGSSEKGMGHNQEVLASPTGPIAVKWLKDA